MKINKQTEFRTKERLIDNLTLEGRTELIESAEELGVDVEGYVELVLFQNKTDSFWIESNLVKDNIKEVIKYGKNDKDTKLFSL